MSAAGPRRTLVGTGSYGIGFTERVFMTEEWLEIDETDGGEIRRVRVPYEDVLLVTRHVSRPWIVGVLLALPALGLLGLSVALLLEGSHGAAVGASISGLCGLFILAVLLVAVGFGTAVVGVYGERSKARLRFVRRGKAASAAESILVRVRRARRAAEAAAHPDRDAPAAPGPDASGADSAGS